MKSLPTATISSPCTGVCRLDDDEICTGCLRSKDEIANWTQMNDHDKFSINAALAGRWKNVATDKRQMDTDGHG
jgi:uncharacterized protein